MKELFIEAYSLVIFLFVIMASVLLWQNVDIGFNPTEQSWFTYILNTLLAIGFYASVRAISYKSFTDNFLDITKFITLGIFIKTVLVGGFFYWLTGDLFGFALGIIVAQIDPLSVPAVLTEQATLLSEKGKNLLLAWASFDSPISALFTLLCIQLVFPANAHWGESLFLLSLNALLPLAVYLINKYIRLVRDNNSLQIFLLALVFIVSVHFELLLGLAICALFLRPVLKFDIDFVVGSAYIISLVLLGYFIASGIDIVDALAVSALVIIAQLITVNLLKHKLDLRDKKYLQFAQQNGVTAIVLAIYFEQYSPGITSIIAPVIVLVNTVHLFVFTRLNKVSVI